MYDAAKEFFDALESGATKEEIEALRQALVQLEAEYAENPAYLAWIRQKYTAKKMEVQQDNVAPYVDCVITFEELQALFDSRDIDITTLSETELDNASYYGRIFAKCGGLSEAVQQAIKEQGLTDFDLKSINCDGIEACRVALLKAQKRVLDANFIEGMACNGGCIGGAGCLTHGERNKLDVDKNSKKSKKVDMKTAIEDYNL